MRDSWCFCHLRSSVKKCAPLLREGLERAGVPAQGVFLGELRTLSQYPYLCHARATSTKSGPGVAIVSKVRPSALFSL